MRDAAGELADGLQLLALGDLRLEIGLLGHVLRDDNQAIPEGLRREADAAVGRSLQCRVDAAAGGGGEAGEGWLVEGEATGERRCGAARPVADAGDGTECIVGGENDARPADDGGGGR